ncbi:MAG TPA: helicase C-terminal domain-containing protein [Phycisphaerae bacterium]|nr:helicase C-terminal domain-containing protein [Phycisphaerae bacterium]
MAIVVKEFFGPSGPVARRLPGFEPRPQQEEMAAAVERAFEREEHLIAEAGTGVGKSFAYLVPAIAQAAKGKKVVISTHTISLQEQLIEKDIPFLRAVSGLEFSAVLCKGRSNYLCMRRLEQASKKSLTLFPDTRSSDDLFMIEDWARTTKDGSLSDLPRQPAWQVWDKVCAERGNCLGRRCRYYDGCFYQASRRRIQNGQILVCNHALFFSDLAIKRAGAGGILPKYDFVVLDEAHTVEGVASDHFGLAISESQVRYLLHSLFSGKTTRGFLATLDNLDTLSAIAAVEQADTSTNSFFEHLDRWLARAPKNGRVRQKNIIEDDLSPALDELSKALTGLSSQLAAKSKEHRKIVDDPEDGDTLTGVEYEIEKQRFELQSYADRVGGIAASVRALLAQDLEDAVYWVEATGKTNRRLKWTGSPINVAPQLQKHLFDSETIKSVILTSATLSTHQRGGDAFDYLRSRVGLDAAGAELQVGSPFDYPKQCTLYLEVGLPLPDEEPFLSIAMQRAMHYLRQTQGRAFLLFTSYTMLDKAARILAPELAQLGYPMLAQGGQLTRGQLLSRFKSTPNSVLLGTDSFWQGVDVQGDALSNVIIVKLPFEVPDKPLTEARLDAIRDRGGNPFGDYSLPEAIIKFKQGFGRLIRSKTDTGIVVVLDKRIVTKQYGSQFIQALPPCRTVRVTT